MKVLLTTSIVALLASSSFANQTSTVDWTGNTDDLTPGCSFTTNNDGEMTYSESTQTWSTDTPANVTILVRHEPSDKTDKITVEPVHEDVSVAGGSVFGGGDEWDADIDYTAGSSYDGSLPTDWQWSLTNELITVTTDTDVSGVVTINVGGDADISNALGATDILDANTEYKSRHLITCFNDGDGQSGPGNCPAHGGGDGTGNCGVGQGGGGGNGTGNEGNGQGPGGNNGGGNG